MGREWRQQRRSSEWGRNEVDDDSLPKDLPAGLTIKSKKNTDEASEKREQATTEEIPILTSLTIKAKKDGTGQCTIIKGRVAGLI